MQFITNKISTNSNSKTFSQIVAEMKNKNVKTASSDASTKVAEADEAPSSGQPEAEAKLVNDPKKDNTSKSSKKDCKEAPSSGQPEAEAKLVNEPEAKEASKKGQDYDDEQGEVPGEQDTGPNEYAPVGGEDDKDDKDDKDEKKDEKDDKKDDKGLTEKQEKLPEGLKDAIKNKKEAGKDEAGKRDGTGPYKDSSQNKTKEEGKRKEKGEKCPEEEKEASENLKWIKVANLNDKTKTWLRKYYSNIWPAEFVEALLADK